MEDIIFGGVTNFMVAAILVVSIIYLTITIYTNHWSKKFPPGPGGLSGLWQLLKAFRSETIPELCWEWAEKYGPLTFFRFGGIKFCLVNTSDKSRLLLASEKYKGLTSDRIPNFTSEFAVYGGKDIFFTSHDVVTRRKRRLFHKAISLYGDGVEKFEKIVEEEVDILISDLQANAKQGQDVQMDDRLSRTLKNILYMLMTGKRPARNEDVDAVENFDLALNDLNTEHNQFPLMAAPWLRFFPGRFKDVCQKVLDTRTKAEEIMFARLKFRLSNLCPHL